MFENRVLRRIFGPKRDEITGEWKKLHNEELNDLYPSPNIVLVIKYRRKMCGACSTYGGEKGCIRAGFWSGNLRITEHFEDRGVDRKIILRWIFRQCDGGMDWIDPAQNWDK